MSRAAYKLPAPDRMQFIIMNSFESRTATLNIYAKVEVEQLGYCNAFVRSCYLHDGDGLILAKRELVSYCTPVVAIGYGLHENPVLVTCAPAATCSATTRKHVGRFLKQFCPSLSYYDIKHALEKPAQYYRNGLRVIELETSAVYERPDNMHAYGVRYESIKPFNPWY